jgi:adenosylhomocysteine nucleosidase
VATHLEASIVHRFAGPVICFALNREAFAFLKTTARKQPVRHVPGEVWFVESNAHPLLVLITGVGTSATECALQWLFDRAAPSLVIAAGFAGSLTPRFAVGEVIDCCEILDSSPNSWQVPNRASALPTARLITFSRLVATAADKFSLAEMSGAHVVDMESAAIARMTSERGIPFACIRAVSDAHDSALSPKLVKLLSGGRVSPWRLAGALVRSPRLVTELIRLARDTQKAANNLATALHRFLAQTAAATRAQ